MRLMEPSLYELRGLWHDQEAPQSERFLPSLLRELETKNKHETKRLPSVQPTQENGEREV